MFLRDAGATVCNDDFVSLKSAMPVPCRMNADEEFAIPLHRFNGV